MKRNRIAPRPAAAASGGVEPGAPCVELSTDPIGPLGPVSYELGHCRLEVLEGPDAGKACTFDPASVLVGTAAECDLVLSDSTVSRHHLRLETDTRGVRVLDCGSRNGTRVDGVRVADAYLAPGSVIALGHTRLRFSQVVESIPAPPGLRSELFGLIGASAAMRQLFSVIERLGPRPISVLITGETGTGKELVARALHLSSDRSGGPFVVFDCANTDRDLVRSELFGHEPGAFTGAAGRREGAFERAAGGTVFLDELGELPLELQPRLLRVLQEREVTRLGASRPFRVNVRILAATHRDLRLKVTEGTFREDLFFRVAQLHLRVPPLRERREDIPVLARAILQQLTPELGFDEAALQLLAALDWPGNVRELRNCVETAAALADGAVLGTRELQATSLPGRPDAIRGDSLRATSLAAVERTAVARVLQACGGNLSAAARELGVTRVTLRAKLRKYGLLPPSAR